MQEVSGCNIGLDIMTVFFAMFLTPPPKENSWIVLQIRSLAPPFQLAAAVTEPFNAI
jgi:hypothetical protein